MKKYIASNKAYYDSFTGLHPCKVIDTDNNRMVTVEFTTDHKGGNFGGWRKGERYTTYAHNVIPRCEISVRNGQYRKSTFYAWIKTDNGIKNIRTRDEF